MTIEEKSKKIEEYCDSIKGCSDGCKLFLAHGGNATCYSISNKSDELQIEENFEILFGCKHDPVNHPSHYTKGKIEVADFIADQKLNFDRGNAVKYVCRAGSKDPEKEIQDLEKAIWYINHEIKMLKGENESGTEKET